MAVSERSLEQKFIVQCRKNKVKTMKGDARNNIGFPDRVVFIHQIKEIHFVEFKNETYYSQTIPQKHWQDIIEKAGGKYFLINGEEEMNNYINKYIKQPTTKAYLKEIEEYYDIEERDE